MPRAELGSQPTESAFEEITADTLVGPHFVKTYAARPASQVGDPDIPRTDPNFPCRQQAHLRGTLAACAVRIPRSVGVYVTAG
jgi:hypothetical protein